MRNGACQIQKERGFHPFYYLVSGIVPCCYCCLPGLTKNKKLFLQTGSPISNPYFSRPFFGFKLRLQKVGTVGFLRVVVCSQLLLSNGKSEEAGRVMIELLGTYTTENASQAREEAQRCIIASLAGTGLPVVYDIRVRIFQYGCMTKNLRKNVPVQIEILKIY